MGHTSFPAASIPTAVEQWARTPRERWPRNAIQSYEEQLSRFDAELRGQVTKSVAQTDSGYDKNNSRAVIIIPQSETDSIQEANGLTSSKQNSKNEECKAFWKVQEAERYLDLVMSIYPENAAPIRTNESGRLGCWTLKALCNLPWNPDRSGRRILIKSLVRKKGITIGHQRCLIRYLKALRTHPSSRLPHFYNWMKELNEKVKAPHQDDLWIATDVRMFQMPLKTTPIYWITFASIKLLVIFLMILQLELTISWNNISGLSKMNTPGQLIPLILGLCGLVRVLWCK